VARKTLAPPSACSCFATSPAALDMASRPLAVWAVVVWAVVVWAVVVWAVVVWAGCRRPRGLHALYADGASPDERKGVGWLTCGSVLVASALMNRVAPPKSQLIPVE
jgi:hypothetical protein